MGRVASTVSALGSGTANGEIAFLRVSQGGESHLERLTWDSTASKWVGKSTMPITSGDGQFVGAMDGSASDWKYLGQSAGPLGTWFLRAGSVPFAGALYAAGLKLQDRMSARCFDSSGAPWWLSPWYYEYDSGDPLIFDNDVAAQGGKTWNGHADLGYEPATLNIGHGVVLKSDGLGGANGKMTTIGQYDDSIAAGPYPGLAARQPGWDYVKFYVASTPAGAALGGVPTSVPYTPTKKFLYPTLYAIANNVIDGVAAIGYQVRWSS